MEESDPLDRLDFALGAQRGLSVHQPPAWRGLQASASQGRGLGVWPARASGCHCGVSSGAPAPTHTSPSPPALQARPPSLTQGRPWPGQPHGWLEQWSEVTERRCHFIPPRGGGQGDKAPRDVGDRPRGPGLGSPLPWGRGRGSGCPEGVVHTWPAGSRDTEEFSSFGTECVPSWSGRQD